MADASSIDVAGALQVLQTFVAANARGDTDAMRACLTESTLASGSFTGAANQDGVVTLGTPTTDGEGDAAKVFIPMKMSPPMSPEIEAIPEAERPSQELLAHMVRENGVWKFDLQASTAELMKALEAAMGEAMGQIGTAMSGMADGIAGAFKEAFGGEGGSASETIEEAQTWDGVSLEPESHELFTQAHMTTLEKTQAAMSESLGFEVPCRVDLGGLLALFGSTESKQMLDWLDEQLLAMWPHNIVGGYTSQQLENGGFVLKDRLHGFRLEPAQDLAERFVATDLNEVIYRFDPRHSDGYFSDDELRRLMVGVLAGLPEPINPASATMTTFSDRGAPTSVEDYTNILAPRAMLRINQLVGRNVRLDIDWDSLRDVTNAGMLLQRWGLGRVVGGIVLASLDSYVGDRIKDNLRAIRLSGTYYTSDRMVKFENGRLEIRVCLTGHEKGCFYEVDIAEALDGKPILPLEESSADALTSEPAGESADDAAGSGDSETSTEGMTLEEREAAEYRAEMARSEQLNNENFDSAIESLQSAVPAWQMQLQYALGHETPLEIEWNSLNRQYPLVQGMVHVCIAKSLEAISAAGFDPKTKERIGQAVQSVRIRHAYRDGAEGSGTPPITLDRGELIFNLDASTNAEDFASDALVSALRFLIGAAHYDAGSPEENTFRGGNYIGSAEMPTIVPRRSRNTRPEDRPPTLADVMRSSGATRAQIALAYMDRVESTMIEAKAWPIATRPEKIEVRGAFGGESMPFEHWLAWVFIPRVREIAAEGSAFPSSSSVGTYAVRQFDGMEECRDLVNLLCEFDRFIDSGV